MLVSIGEVGSRSYFNCWSKGLWEALFTQIQLKTTCLELCLKQGWDSETYVWTVWVLVLFVIILADVCIWMIYINIWDL